MSALGDPVVLLDPLCYRRGAKAPLQALSKSRCCRKHSRSTDLLENNRHHVDGGAHHDHILLTVSRRVGGRFDVDGTQR